MAKWTAKALACSRDTSGYTPSPLEAALARWGTPVAVVSDRYRIVELRPHLEAVHFPKTTQLVERGMGYRGRQGLPAGGDGWTRDAGQVSAAAVEHGGGADCE